MDYQFTILNYVTEKRSRRDKKQGTKEEVHEKQETWSRRIGDWTVTKCTVKETRDERVRDSKGASKKITISGGPTGKIYSRIRNCLNSWHWTVIVGKR